MNARQDWNARLLATVDADMRESYGFGLPLAIPRYRSGARGAWRVTARQGGVGRPGDSYLSEDSIEPDHHVLWREDVAWMSTGLLELQSHAWHVSQSRGTVVAAGLGLGMFAAAAAAKPEVTRVIVAECDPDVIALHAEIGGLDGPGSEKIEILRCDAASRGFVEAVGLRLAGAEIGYAYADIWPTYPDPDAPRWTREWVGRLGAGRSGYWGQEVEVAQRSWNAGDRLTLSSARRILAEIGVRCDLDDGALEFLRDVASAHGVSEAAASQDWTRACESSSRSAISTAA